MKVTLSIWAILLLMGGLSIAAEARGALPPHPDPHPKACKKGRPCKAIIVKQAYTYRITWTITDENGTVIGTAPGLCTVPVKGPVTCSITIRW